MIIIDAGHGGSDPGAIANGIIEKEYTLKMSLYMYNRLKQLGIPAALTRDSDITLNPSDRIEVIQRLGDVKGNILVSNHLNAGGGDGAEVIYALRSTPDFPRLILEEIAEEGQNIRGYYQRRSTTNPDLDYYYLMRETNNLQPVIVEYGFVDSPGDDVRQIKENYEGLAEATVRAITRYLDVPYFPPQTNTHIVVAGDTLFSLANRFGTTVEAIMQANNLTSSNLHIGQVLIIPTTQTPTITHTVVAGDTLFALANRFGTTVDAIMRANNLTSSNLSIGQILVIPTGSTSTITHRVVSGDTLFSLANRFNTTVEAIMRANNLANPNLIIGQILVIPNNQTSFIYTVVANDSLYSIANRFGITVDMIKEDNNLTSNLLSIGQKLIIRKG